MAMPITKTATSTSRRINISNQKPPAVAISGRLSRESIYIKIDL